MAKRTSKTKKNTTTTKRAIRSKETAGTSARKTSTPRSKAGIVTEQRIRERAHEIYLSRNEGCGDAHSDWFQAERDLRS